MSRITRLEEKIERLQRRIHSGEYERPKEKKWKFPFKIRSLMKKSNKKAEHVLVQYLDKQYQMSFRLERVISGSLVIINNKVHTLNPKAIWTFLKYKVYIIREIDRLPVSNLDYDKVRMRKDDTEADVPLIKAVLGAVQKPKIAVQPKNIAIIIIILIVVIGGIYLFMR